MTRMHVYDATLEPYSSISSKIPNAFVTLFKRKFMIVVFWKFPILYLDQVIEVVGRLHLMIVISCMLLNMSMLRPKCTVQVFK